MQRFNHLDPRYLPRWQPAAPCQIHDVSPAMATVLGVAIGGVNGSQSRHEVAVGGEINVYLDGGVTLDSNVTARGGSLFEAAPTATSWRD